MRHDLALMIAHSAIVMWPFAQNPSTSGMISLLEAISLSVADDSSHGPEIRRSQRPSFCSKEQVVLRNNERRILPLRLSE